jgi:hypothetical protein
VKDDRIYLHIRDITDIAMYTNAGRDGFFAERMRQDATLRKLEVIGQAAKKPVGRNQVTPKGYGLSPDSQFKTIVMADGAVSSTAAFIRNRPSGAIAYSGPPGENACAVGQARWDERHGHTQIQRFAVRAHSYRNRHQARVRPAPRSATHCRRASCREEIRARDPTPVGAEKRAP